MSTITISPILIYLIDRLDGLNVLIVLLLVMTVIVTVASIINYYNCESDFNEHYNRSSMLSHIRSIEYTLGTLSDSVSNSSSTKMVGLSCNTKKLINVIDNLDIVKRKQDELLTIYKLHYHKSVTSLIISIATLIFLSVLYVLVPTTKSAYNIYIHSFYPEVDLSKIQMYFNSIQTMLDGMSH